MDWRKSPLCNIALYRVGPILIRFAEKKSQKIYLAVRNGMQNEIETVELNNNRSAAVYWKPKLILKILQMVLTWHTTNSEWIRRLRLTTLRHVQTHSTTVLLLQLINGKCRDVLKNTWSCASPITTRCQVAHTLCLNKTGQFWHARTNFGNFWKTSAHF